MAEKTQEVKQPRFKVWLTEQMDKRKLGSNELGELAGLSKGTVSDIRNPNNNASLKTMNKLAVALGVPVCNLLELADMIPPQKDYTPKERHLVHIYRELPTDKAQMLLSFARFLQGDS